MRPLVLLPLLFSCACVSEHPLNTELSSEESMQERLGLSDTEVELLLAFLCDCKTTYGLLDQAVPLPSDAAGSLVAHRDGPDSLCGTADDDPFGDLEEVDAVPNVGDATVLTIWEFVRNGGDPTYDGGGTWEDVTFTGHEAEVVLEIANQASLDELDQDIGLSSAASSSIVDNRPHPTMDHLAGTPEVGTATLQALKDYVPSW